MAKVNYNLVPLSYVLKSGEQIEIITSKIQKPKEEWLQSVLTSKAREKIKDAIRVDRKIQIEEGKVRFVKFLAEQNITYSDEFVLSVARRMGYKSLNDFLYNLNNDEVSISELKKYIENKEGKRSFIDYITFTTPCEMAYNQ